MSILIENDYNFALKPNKMPLLPSKTMNFKNEIDLFGQTPTMHMHDYNFDTKKGKHDNMCKRYDIYKYLPNKHF